MSLFGVFVVSYWCIMRCCIVLVFYALLHRIGVLSLLHRIGVLCVVTSYWCFIRCCIVLVYYALLQCRYMDNQERSSNLGHP